MAKSKNAGLSASSKKIDPTLDALFSASSGPVQAPPKSRYSDLVVPKATQESESEDEDEEGEEEDASGDDGSEGEDDEAGETSESVGDHESDEGTDSGDSEEDARHAAAQILAEAQEQERKQRKKRKQDDFHDLESKYFQKLADEEPPASKKRKGPDGEAADKAAVSKVKGDEDESDGEIPVHESLAQAQNKPDNEIEKASRTVFLSNVSLEAASSKKAKKTLMAHLSSILDKDASPPQSIESLRFRSLPFSTAAMPKRAAYITKATMEATTHSANAYVVYSSAAVARVACAKLNGTVVLDRHLRVDSVAHPAETDHRRCVFVGNLGFVDDETVLNLKIDEEGKEKTEKRKRTKVPMDVEEGLWRTFGQHAGKVESVRVVRDPVTRVGKGIAYVQFYDGISVESALLLNEKKFPPMLPRQLRVSRCKAPYKTAKAMEKKQSEKIAALKETGKAKKGTKYVRKLTAEEQTLAGRAGKLMGRSAGAKARIEKSGGKRRDRRDRGGQKSDKGAKEGIAAFKTPEAIVFEGRRASSRDAKPKDLKQKQRKAGSKSKGKKSGK